MSTATIDMLAIDKVEFVKELYPRLREDDAAIERYRAAIDRLPPIAIARGHVLVDGFHRWQAYRREGLTEIAVENLGNLTDIEILKESIRRNASHGRQLEEGDKKRMVELLYRGGTRDKQELADLLSIALSTVEKYWATARSDEKADQQAKAWDLWLDCLSIRDVATALDGPDENTVGGWLSRKADESGFRDAPASRQHFDIWNFQKADDDAGSASYFGRMPSQVVENLLWFYTEPGDIVFDPFAGGGTTIDVAKRMGRRVWSSDRKPSTPTLPIHEHDIAKGWPKDAPSKADFILLDPPYWQQAKGRYSDDAADLGNMSLDDFMASWKKIVTECVKHLSPDGRLAFIISPTQLDDGSVVDHAYAMATITGLTVERRIIVPYQTQQATGQQVEWAREQKRMLKLYRDLVVLHP